MKEALEESHLEKINIDNLQQGKDSDGNDMPRYRDPDYANFKTSINSRNRGHWDLRLTGEYYKGINTKIFGTKVFFKQRYSNAKINWLNQRLSNRKPLGITNQQMFDAQKRNIPKIKQRILNIINNGG